MKNSMSTPMKNLLIGLSTAIVLATSAFAALPVPAPIPVLVAESEDFEIVGRLDDKGFVFHVDRSDTNQPVLNAQLEVDIDGRAMTAVYRPTHGDYLIDDAAWLAPLRQVGEYAVSLTLLAGEESDLLTADFAVDAPSTAENAHANEAPWLFMLLATAVLVALAWMVQRKKKGGVA